MKHLVIAVSRHSPRSQASRYTLLLRGLSILALLPIMLVTSCFSAVSPSVITQPLSGPGGQDYTHDTVAAKRYGAGSEEVWVFYPDTPPSAGATVVFFMHGWGGYAPEPYGAWIEHLVRKGNVVVFPRYQDNILTPIEEISAGAVQGVQTAWREIMDDAFIDVRTDRVGWVGHSLGAYLAVNIATQSSTLGLPTPALLMLVEPGSTERLDFADTSGIPEDTPIIVADGDRDCVVECDGSIAFMDEASQHPEKNIVRILMQSDPNVTPALLADHFSPLARSSKFTALVGEVSQVGQFDGTSFLDEFADSQRLPDDLDYRGYWTVLDVLLACAFELDEVNSDLNSKIFESSMNTSIDSRTRFTIYERTMDGTPRACAAEAACSGGTP